MFGKISNISQNISKDFKGFQNTSEDSTRISKISKIS